MMRALFVAMAVAIALTDGQLIADSCSISCPGQVLTSTADLRQKYIGPPGKRGAIGPVGSPGPIGLAGSKGEQGESCNCKSFEDQLASVKTAVDRLKALTDWKEASNGYWYRLFRTQVTFQKAREICKQHGSRLASAGMRRLSTIREIISLVGIQRDEYVWIGLSDLRKEGSFVWDDGSTAPVTNWGSGQPDNGRNNNEHCGHFWRGYKFNDIECNTEMNLLCEIHLD